MFRKPPYDLILLTTMPVGYDICQYMIRNKHEQQHRDSRQRFTDVKLGTQNLGVVPPSDVCLFLEVYNCHKP